MIKLLSFLLLCSTSYVPALITSSVSTCDCRLFLVNFKSTNPESTVFILFVATHYCYETITAEDIVKNAVPHIFLRYDVVISLRPLLQGSSAALL